MTKEEVNISIGRMIRKCRREKGITTEQLAEKIQISNNALSNIERGKSMPTLMHFIEIANVLDVSADTLLKDVVIASNISHVVDLLKDVEQLPSEIRTVITAGIEAQIRAWLELSQKHY